jgi:molybdenum storage protein
MVRADGRKHLKSRLMGSTLIEEGILKKTKNQPIRLMPDLVIVKIGGQSMMDYGRAAIYPIVKEIIRLRKKHKMLLVMGGGTRSRHTYDIALDLGLPVGMLASLGEMISTQNALMMYGLLAANGGARITKEDIPELPMYFQKGFIPIINGMPPYNWWEPPSKIGSIPSHRTDVGAYLLAEVLGAKKMIFVKDEEGLYDDNPKNNPKAKFIARISAKELLDRNLPDYPIEKPVLEMMENARFATEISIINGQKPGNLTKALEGRKVGSVIYSQR